MTQEFAEKRVAITGIGQSQVSRGSDKSALELTVDACMEAIEDSGLKRKDIDGIASYPGADGDTSGFSPVGVPELQDALRIEVDYYGGIRETSGQLGAVFGAIGAIASGVCRNVLVFRSVYEATARKAQHFANAMATPERRVTGELGWFAPFWTLSAATQQALYFQRYVNLFGIKEEQIAQIAINNRRNAALNPNAVYKTPITLEDYRNSRWISTPLRLFDCDVPIDGSTALVLSRLDVAKGLRNPVIRFDAIGSALRDRNSWAQLRCLETQATPSPAAMMWNRTDLKPGDVDMAQLYDGFSFHSMMWLESFGFCGRGEAGAFIEGGNRIARDGEMPINTSGGQLSAGRLHGYGQVHEACAQLWGRGGARQIPGSPRTAVTSTAGGPLAGCILLVRE
jgi:acetyl-CoA acetyltransferase